METYLSDIRRTPLLNYEEEQDLAYRIRDGDPKARDQMVRANLRLVVHVAKSYLGRSLPLADLVAEGNLGLLRAVKGFDPAMNTRFSTYATSCIRQAISDGLRTIGPTIPVPAYAAALVAKWRRVAVEVTAELGRKATDEEVVARLGFSRRHLRIVQKALRLTPFRCGALPEGEPGSLADLLADVRDPAPGGVTAAAEVREVLDHLSRLKPRQAWVLRLRFGLDGEQPQSLQAIGQHLGLTRERVRQIANEALRALGARLGAG